MAANALRVVDLQRVMRGDENGLVGIVCFVSVIELPEDGKAVERLRSLGVSAEDRAETLEARPDPHLHPDLWARLEGCHSALLSEMGAGLPPSGYRGFPAVPLESGPVGLHLYVWLYASVLPEVRRFHASRGIPDEISWTTLSLLGPEMAEHRTIHGVGGIGRFGQWCPPLRYRGAEYNLGRLIFDRGRGELPDGGTGFCLNVHIPGGGVRLAPESCDGSLQQALEFFGRHFDDEPVEAFVCHSWLLDPQLAEYLPADSNIVRFQRRFELKPLDQPTIRSCDPDVLEYVFGQVVDETSVTDELLDSLPQDTTMRRAFVSHLRSGRHWQARTGWIRV